MHFLFEELPLREADPPLVGLTVLEDDLEEAVAHFGSQELEEVLELDLFAIVLRGCDQLRDNKTAVTWDWEVFHVPRLDFGGALLLIVGVLCEELEALHRVKCEVVEEAVCVGVDLEVAHEDVRAEVIDCFINDIKGWCLLPLGCVANRKDWDSGDDGAAVIDENGVLGVR